VSASDVTTVAMAGVAAMLRHGETLTFKKGLEI
jgi:hypothetical protein